MRYGFTALPFIMETIAKHETKKAIAMGITASRDRLIAEPTQAEVSAVEKGRQLGRSQLTRALLPERAEPAPNPDAPAISSTDRAMLESLFGKP